MLKQVLVVWAIADLVIVGLVSWIAGGWYIGWHVSPVIGMLAELGLIMVPNLVLPVVVLRYGWPEPVDSIRDALGWRWNGWRSPLVGALAFIASYVLVKVIVWLVGGSIPYHLPGTTGEGIAIDEPLDLLRVLGLLLGLLAFVDDHRGGGRNDVPGLYSDAGRGTLWGLVRATVERCAIWVAPLARRPILRGIWQATPQMWLSRQLQLYIGAICLDWLATLGKAPMRQRLCMGLSLWWRFLDWDSATNPLYAYSSAISIAARVHSCSRSGWPLRVCSSRSTIW